MTPVTWGQFGLAGLIALTLGGVVAYVFKLFVSVQTEAMARAIKERDEFNAENIKLHERFLEQQRSTLTVLSDVARVMAEVQNMLREREIQQIADRRRDGNP